MMAAEAEIVMPESGYSLGAGKRKGSPWNIF